MTFTVTHIFTDAQGETHFEDKQVPMEAIKVGSKSETVKTTGLQFRSMPDDYDSGWHNTSDRQYVVILEGGVEMQTSDGESRTFGAGDILFVEDTAGKGHLSKAVRGQARKCLFIKVD